MSKDKEMKQQNKELDEELGNVSGGVAQEKVLRQPLAKRVGNGVVPREFQNGVKPHSADPGQTGKAMMY